MSIIFFEGFDLYGTASVKDLQQGLATRSEIWADKFDYIKDEDADSMSRNDGNAMYFSSGDSTSQPGSISSRRGLASTTKAIAGTAFMSAHFAYYGYEDGPVVLGLHGGRDYSSLQNGRIHARLEDDSQTDSFMMHVNIYEGASTSISYTHTINSLSHDIWHYLELEYDSTPGNAHARAWLNGLLVVDQVLTGSDDYEINGAGFGGSFKNTGTNKLWRDDMYFLDANDASDGAAFQQRLGPIQIRPCPLTADTSPSSWVASSGGAKYQDVDEQPGPNDLDATYVSTVTAPQTQMFNCSPYDADLPIIAVTSFAAVKQPDPTNGVAQLAFMVDDQEDPSPLPLQGTYRLFSQNYVTLPGGSITVPVIQATDWGVRSLPSS